MSFDIANPTASAFNRLASLTLAPCFCPQLIVAQGKTFDPGYHIRKRIDFVQ